MRSGLKDNIGIGVDIMTMIENKGLRLILLIGLPNLINICNGKFK